MQLLKSLFHYNTPNNLINCSLLNSKVLFLKSPPQYMNSKWYSLPQNTWASQRVVLTKGKKYK